MSGIVTSPDGVTWTAANITDPMTAVGWSGTLGIAAGPSTGSTTVGSIEWYTSTTGTSWLGPNVLQMGSVAGIAYSPSLGLWVMVGAPYYSIPTVWAPNTSYATGSSPNFANTVVPTNVNGWLYYASTGGASDPGEPQPWPTVLGGTYTETSGLTWTAVSPATIYTSPDGSTWTPQSSPFDITQHGAAPTSVAWSPVAGVFIVTADPNNGRRCIAISTDGVNWSEVESPLATAESVQWVGDRFVATGFYRGDATQQPIISFGGHDWWVAHLPATGTGTAPSAIGGYASLGLVMEVTPSATGGDYIATSTDGGFTWAATSSPMNAYGGAISAVGWTAAVGNTLGQFLAVGTINESAAVRVAMASEDLENWYVVETPFDQPSGAPVAQGITWASGVNLWLLAGTGTGGAPSMTAPVFPGPYVPPGPPTYVPGNWHFELAQLDGTLIGELIDARSRSVTWYLSQSGVASFNLAGKDPNATLVNELTTDLVVMCGANRMWRGRVGTSTDQVDVTGHEISFSAVDYVGLLTTRRFIWPPAETQFPHVDYALVAWDLVFETQNQPSGDLGITRGTFLLTGELMPVSPSNYNNQPVFNYGDAVGADIATLASGYPGFQWEVDGNLNFNLWPLNKGTSGIGRGTTRTGIVLDLGGSVIAVTRTFNVSTFANATLGTGSWSPQQDTIMSWQGSSRIVDSYILAPGPNQGNGNLGFYVVGTGIPASEPPPTVTQIFPQRSLPNFGGPSLPPIASASTTNNTITFAGATGLVPGQVINISGGGKDFNNGDFHISAVNTSRATIVTLTEPIGSVNVGNAYAIVALGNLADNSVTFATGTGLNPGDVVQIEGGGLGFHNGYFHVASVGEFNTVVLDATEPLGSLHMGNAYATFPAQFELSAAATLTQTAGLVNLGVWDAQVVGVNMSGTIGAGQRLESVASNVDILAISALQQWTAAQAAVAAVPTPSYAMRLNPEWGWDPSKLWLGDTIRCVVYSGRLTVDDVLQVQQIDLTLSDDAGGTPDVTITVGQIQPKLHDRLIGYDQRIHRLESR